MKIYAGSDHAGVRLRGRLTDHLRRQGHEVVDMGPDVETACDYPGQAAMVARAVRRDPGSYGLLTCGSGVGVCISANKVRGIRAVSPWNVDLARLSRAHNDANVLCLGERLIPEADAVAMLDAWLTTPFERGRHVLRIAKLTGVEKGEGAAYAVDAEVALLQRREVPGRIWKREVQVFVPDANAGTARSIASRLGWLDLSERMAAKTAALTEFAREVQAAGTREVVLLGMGGSSLAAEALAASFPGASGLRLRVLDSTDPAAVTEVQASIKLPETLFVVASKSGATIEVNALEDHFWNLACAARGGAKQAATRFVAITDPGTPLAARAKQRRYRATFLGDPNIGGRYAALSLFGLMPAALLGLDIEALLASGRRMAHACAEPAVAKNPGASLGARIAALSKQGRDKLTLVISPEIQTLGAWIEQLVGESLGKDGQGVLPVNLEPLGPPEIYGPDRQFVVIDLEGATPAASEQQIEALQGTGQPVLRYALPDRYDLGAEFFRWQFATAVAGAALGRNPFDEPNVAAANRMTGQLLAAHEKTSRRHPKGKAKATGRAKAASKSVAFAATPGISPDDAQAILGHLGTSRPGDYIAFCAFFHRNDERQGLLTEVRLACRDRLPAATIVGFGPHKGGPGAGVFVQLVADSATDIPIPGARYGFAILRDAQAEADLRTLRQRGRRVLRIQLGTDVETGLRRLLGSLRNAGATSAETL